MKSFLRLVTASLVGISLARGGVIEDAFQRLYNFDFAGSHRILDPYIRDNPSDPLGHSTRAAAYLFSELDRLQVLAGEFLTDDKKISGDDVLAPNPVVRDKFFASIALAQKAAEARLIESPKDSIALFSFCLTEGMKTDYTAFIEKKQLRSLGSARRAHNYAVELIRHDPGFVDAHLTTGLTEYLVGSLPFFIRWFVRFEEVQGSKKQAATNLELVAREGRYLGPFARILLSILYVREKKPHATIRLLEDLVRDFPENPLLRRELAKLRVKYPEPQLKPGR